MLDTCGVTTPNTKERMDFQAQERQRVFKPHRSFTYRMHGYEVIVGPVRGVYNSSNIRKPVRGHSLLIDSRPHYISILVLVRDAIARLPNGMGTHSDICALLKDSQYLMEANQTELHNAVSDALDRLLYEHDPCVKYDPKRKIWIYLHKERTMEEFERLHLEEKDAVKMKCWRRRKTQKKWTPDAIRTSNRKWTSNVPMESLSTLDLPTRSTSGSMTSSNTSTLLSKTHTNQEMISNMENLKRSCVMKTSECVKIRKLHMQAVQTTDNAVEQKIECSTMDQNSSDTSKLFAMPVSNIISTITTDSPSMTVSKITSQSIASIVSSQSIVSNVTSPSIAKQSFTCKMTNQPIVRKITSQSLVTNNMFGQSVGNISLQVVKTQTIANCGQMNNISQYINNSQPLTVLNSNKMFLNSTSKNKRKFSSDDLITTGPPKKKVKHINIIQPVTIEQSSVTSSFQHDHHITITKSSQCKEPQRPILFIKPKQTDWTLSYCEPIVRKITSQSMMTNNMFGQSVGNTSLQVDNSLTIANSGHMNNMNNSYQSTNNSQQLTLVNSNKMVVNSISTNKRKISPDDLKTIFSPKKKAKHIHITQPDTIGQSSVTSSFQHDHHLTITKPPQGKESQRPIFIPNQKRTDRNISSCEQTGATIVNHNDTMKSHTVPQSFQLLQQQKIQKQQSQTLQRNQIQQQIKQQVIIRKSDIDDRAEKGDCDHPQVIFVKQSPPRSFQTDTQQTTHLLLPIQTVHTTDNTIELKKECPTTMDQYSSDFYKLFAMPVSNNISTITTNSPSITVSSITSQSNASIFSSQSIVSNVTIPSIAKQSFTCKMNYHPIVRKIMRQSLVINNMFGQSIANTSLKVVISQTIVNCGQMNNISQSTNSSQQLNSISTNKRKISSDDLITIGPPKKKVKHIHIIQPVTIGQSSGMI